jgi:hypothetical protein
MPSFHAGFLWLSHARGGRGDDAASAGGREGALVTGLVLSRQTEAATAVPAAQRQWHGGCFVCGSMSCLYSATTEVLS